MDDRLPVLNPVDFKSGRLLWSATYEDYAVIENALALAPGDRFVSIAGAGCTVLSSLLREPASVVAIDVNPAQIALLELKLESIRQMSAREFAEAMGVDPSTRRLELYERVRSSLQPATQAFFDERRADLANGLLHLGEVDKHYDAFLPILRDIHSDALLDEWFSFTDVAAQAVFFTQKIATPAFKRAYTDHYQWEGRRRANILMPFMITKFGGRGALMDEVGWNGFESLCMNRPMRPNYYMHFLLRRRYQRPDTCPAYLLEENFPLLQKHVDSVRCVVGGIEEQLDALGDERPNKFALSNIFANMRDDEKSGLLLGIEAKIATGGRVVYWDEHALSATQRSRFQSRSALADQLSATDRFTWYGKLHVEEAVS